eukprot:2042666-Pyramimonas_sp.AAC.2
MRVVRSQEYRHVERRPGLLNARARDAIEGQGLVLCLPQIISPHSCRLDVAWPGGRRPQSRDRQPSEIRRSKLLSYNDSAAPL